MRPPETMGTPVPPDRQAAKSALMAPAIILAIIAVLAILLGLVGLAAPQYVGDFASQIRTGDAGLDQQLQETLRASSTASPNVMTIFQFVLMLLLSGTVLAGSIQMMRLRSYGLAMAAAIVSMIPCVGPCCCFAIPFGIWALVVLLKPNVKAAFQ